MSEQKQIFTLEQVANSIKKTIAQRYTSLYWVKAELHKINRYPSGHAFPELVQKVEGKIVAQMSASIWKQHYDRINQLFVQQVKEPLKEGSTMLLQVKIVFSETRGFSLDIIDIDPTFALGELQRERKETLERLQKEGIINKNQTLSFPLLPQRIAIISADTSKGLSDFMQVIENNAFGYRFFTMLFPAYLQGDIAVNSIIEQLNKIEKVKHHFDAVVIVRGGGGEVGLTCYNNFELCKAIALFPLPILSGIGHSTNLTVAEMVAYRNAITPTELADFLIQAFHETSVPVENASKYLRDFSKSFLLLNNQEFLNEIKHFKNAANFFLQQRKVESQSLVHELQTLSQKSIQLAKIDFQVTSSKVRSEAVFLINEQKSSLKLSQTSLFQLLKSELKSQENTLTSLTSKIDLLNPINVLKRGYSITTYQGKTINNKMDLKENTVIHTRTFDSELTSIIKTNKTINHE